MGTDDLIAMILACTVMGSLLCTSIWFACTAIIKVLQRKDERGRGDAQPQSAGQRRDATASPSHQAQREAMDRDRALREASEEPAEPLEAASVQDQLFRERADMMRREM